MRISNINPASLVNGPGIRMVIVFSGCSLNCTGCFSKELQDFDSGKYVTPKQLVRVILKEFKGHTLLDGLTLSGGNPTEQPDLIEFLKLLKEQKPRFDIWLWSGHTWDELLNMKSERCPLKYIDAVVTGRFIKRLQVDGEYYGSSNQEVWKRDKTGRFIKDKKE